MDQDQKALTRLIVFGSKYECAFLMQIKTKFTTTVTVQELKLQGIKLVIVLSSVDILGLNVSRRTLIFFSHKNVR